MLGTSHHGCGVHMQNVVLETRFEHPSARRVLPEGGGARSTQSFGMVQTLTKVNTWHRDFSELRAAYLKVRLVNFEYRVATLEVRVVNIVVGGVNFEAQGRRRVQLTGIGYHQSR